MAIMDQLRKPRLCLVLGFGKLVVHEVYSALGVVLVLVSDALNTELGLGKLQFFISFSPSVYLMFFKIF